jgi:hypothetical protein
MSGHRTAADGADGLTKCSSTESVFIIHLHLIIESPLPFEATA